VTKNQTYDAVVDLMFEGADAVVECPAFFGDPRGTMIWIPDNVVVTDNRFTPEDAQMRIQRNDGGIYRCLIHQCVLVDSRLITVAVLERDSLAQRIVEPSNPIQVMYGDPLDLTCQLEEQKDDMQYTWIVVLIHSKTPKQTRS
jgi:hypothetical protein